MLTIKEVKENPELINQFIEENMPLVTHLISKTFPHARYTDLFQDYFQEGCVGMLKAIKRFDLDKGIQFSTYASSIIIGEVLRYIRDKQHIIRPTRTKEAYTVETLEFNIHNDITLNEVLVSNIDIESTVEKSILLDHVKKHIKKRDFEIFILFIKGYGQTEIAKMVGMSQPHIGRIIRKSQELCRKYLAA